MDKVKGETKISKTIAKPKSREIKNLKHYQEKTIVMKCPLFYALITEIKKPTKLIPNWPCINGSYKKTFCFLGRPSCESRKKSHNWKAVSRWSYDTRIIIRFCLHDSSAPQSDLYPPRLAVRINGHQCTLSPHPSPLDVTNYIHSMPVAAPNRVSVFWRPTKGHQFAMSISIAQKISCESLLEALLKKRPMDLEWTKRLVRRTMRDDIRCQGTNVLSVSLKCPLGHSVLRVPVRSHLCTHLQCMDAMSFLRMNSMRELWRCPCCGGPAPYETLAVDPFFQRIVTSPYLMDATEVEVRPDCSWTPSDSTMLTVNRQKVFVD